MSTIEERIEKAKDSFIKSFGSSDCFRVWVENINCGEKYVVWCSCREEWLGRRRTRKFRKTIE